MKILVTVQTSWPVTDFVEFLRIYLTTLKHQNGK